MGQHGPECDVPDALDVLDRSVELGVDDDSALVVDFDSDIFEVESGGDGSASNSDENDVGLDLDGRLNKFDIRGVKRGGKILT